MKYLPSLFIILFCAIWTLIWFPETFASKLQPKQVWVYEGPNHKNPFEAQPFVTNVVIEIKDGYVQYLSCGSRYFPIESSRISTFRYRAKFIYNISDEQFAEVLELRKLLKVKEEMENRNK